MHSYGDSLLGFTPTPTQMELPLSCDITIRLPKEEYATIAKRALEVDPELNPEKIDKSFETEGTSFIAHFKSVDEKTLRLGVSTFFDMVQVVLRGLSEFGDDSPVS